MKRKQQPKPSEPAVPQPKVEVRPSLRPRSTWTRLMIFLMGIILGQFILYGSSLIGRKILLPLDLLATEAVYLPMTPETRKIVPHDLALGDLVYEFEPMRQFAGAEIRAGRFPMWGPFQYAGSPVIWPKFSPFLLVGCLVASPVILAWVQLASALISGLGAYMFFRRVLGVSFWAATIAAWCYPLTGFFVFWQGFPTCFSVYWLPWILLAVDKTARGNGRWGIIVLSAVTFLVLVSGHIDVAGQVLLVSGLYGIWCLVDVHGRGWWRLQSCRAAAILVVGWGLGFMLAAPHLLPLFEYARTGARVERRSAGKEERPPAGISALPQMVVPDMYGATHAGSFRIAGRNQTESSAAAYAGLLATLFVAPLAFRSRRHRSINIFWCLLGVFALAWCLNLPGLVQFMRLPGLKLMSHNRLVFAASFAILAMTAVGWDTLKLNDGHRRRWFWLPGLLLTGLLAWCMYRAYVLPEPLVSQFEGALRQGRQILGLHDLDGLRQVQVWFTRTYLVASMLCGLGVAGWLLVCFRPAWMASLLPVLGILLVGDMLWFAYGRSAQNDPALYYPRIPALEQLAKLTPGRVVGFGCLPATLAVTHKLQDIRGYDSIDPARLVEVLTLAADPAAPRYPYALTQFFAPRAELIPPDPLKVSPILDALAVRYVIFRGKFPGGVVPTCQSEDYWVMTNPKALARVYIPERVETVADDRVRLQKMAAPEFDPRAVAYVESPMNLSAECRGKAEIISEIPSQVTIALAMESSGMVVLADLWDSGWKAYLNGQEVPIHRANHAVRGVIAPAGKGILEFRYEPASFALGVKLALGAGVFLLLWLTVVLWRKSPLFSLERYRGSGGAIVERTVKKGTF